MKTIYKVLLVLFVIFLGINLYGVQWELGFMHPENSKYVMSIAASVVGIFLLLVMNMWSKLAAKRQH